MLPRATLLAAAILAAPLAVPSTAQAAPLTQDSPIGRLVAVVAAMHACNITATDAQQTAVTNAGQAMQDKLKATDADLDALMEKFGDTPPPGGCEAYKANFDRTLNAAVAGTR